MHDVRTKNVYAGKLTHMVNKYNNIYHSTIKMKPTNIKASTYIDFNKEKNKKDPKFEVSDYGRISKYKNISAKGYEDVFVQIGPRTFLWLKKLETLCRRHILLVILTIKKLLERFTKKNCRRQINKSLKLKKY